MIIAYAVKLNWLFGENDNAAEKGTVYITMMEQNMDVDSDELDSYEWFQHSQRSFLDTHHHYSLIQRVQLNLISEYK